MTTALRSCALFLLATCAPALEQPSPIATYAPGQARGRSVDELLAEANAAWARRAESGQAAAAEALYLDAAVADEHRVDALLGAMRVLAFRIEYQSGAPRERLAREAVELGQWCQRRAPDNAECNYRLAIALGQQARERPSTGHDAVDRMVDLLQRAITVAPRLDDAGPHRVLALLLLRAPAWPAGPGDPEGGLAHARSAVRLAPNAADNQLALGEALLANGRREEARAAYQKAAMLAAATGADRDPEVASWRARARSGIAQTGG